MPFTFTCKPCLTPKEFRDLLNEFSDAGVYTDTSITLWLITAGILLNRPRWGDMLQIGTLLFTAHHLVLQTRAKQTAEVGGFPGVSRGVISSESAGDVSVNYDTAPSLDEHSSHWNLTEYGTQFIYLSNMAGAGPIQIGPTCGNLAGEVIGQGNLGGSGGENGWSGPNCTPGMTTFGG